MHWLGEFRPFIKTRAQRIALFFALLFVTLGVVEPTSAHLHVETENPVTASVVSPFAASGNVSAGRVSFSTSNFRHML